MRDKPDIPIKASLIHGPVNGLRRAAGVINTNSHITRTPIVTWAEVTLASLIPSEKAILIVGDNNP
ncbi:hypothetical protein D3C87_2057920 [compost metagenome]